MAEEKEITLSDLYTTRENFRIEQRKILDEIGENGDKVLFEKLHHINFKINAWSRRIENKLSEIAAEEKKNFKIREFIDGNFSRNPGYQSKVPFKLTIQGVEYIHIDSHFCNEGITRFQGVIITKYDTPCMPALQLLPYIENWQLMSIYEGKVPCFTIWFKKPITQELIEKDIETQSFEETKKLF